MNSSEERHYEVFEYLYRVAYLPPIFNNSSCLPFSTIFPFSSTKITSLSTIVLSLCAMETLVRFCCNLYSDFCTSISLSLSNALVASSKSKIAGSFKNTLAMANLCFSPPDTGSSFVPSSFLLKSSLYMPVWPRLTPHPYQHLVYRIKYSHRHFCEIEQAPVLLDQFSFSIQGDYSLLC